MCGTCEKIWLIEQAKRVQELEKDIKDYERGIVENGIDIFNMTSEMKVLEIQNKRYREAIKRTLQAMGMVDRQKYRQALEQVLEGEE